MKKIIIQLCIIPILFASVSFAAENHIDFDGKTLKSVNFVEAVKTNVSKTDLGMSVLSEKIADLYDFPIKPGTEEWKAMVSHDEMLKACQVPELILQKMSTEGLVETVLNYPLYGDMKAHNSLQQGFDYVFSEFNGLWELFKRKDVGTVLLARYKTMDPSAFKEDATLAEIGHYIWGFEDVEILLAQNAILANLTEIQRQELRKEAFAKYQVKKQHIDNYGQSSMRLTALLVGEELLQNDSLRYYQTSVPTPRGSRVPAFQMVPADELTPAQKQEIYRWLARYYPNARQLTRATRMYNCHSYTWHSQSTSNTIWIDSPNEAWYWIDGSYVRWYSDNAISGMKLDYLSDDHSAIFVSGYNPVLYPMQGYCRSKWGSMPIMYHRCGYSPYNYSSIRAYVRNK